jgi:hypothetical protein
MEYGKIISRSVKIVWQNKFLIILGFLAAIGSGMSTGSFSNDSSSDFSSNPGQFSEFGDEIAAFALALVFGLICVALLVGIVLWVISTIARGGLIAGVDNIESGEKSGFRLAWGAGWHKAGTLLGISLLPAIPALLLFVMGLLAMGAYGGIFAMFGEEFAESAGLAGLGIGMAVLACILIPIMLVLSILRNFAERAAMLENHGVIDAYRRGTSVLMANLGEAFILILLQIGIFIVLGLLLLGPGLIAVICCCLWPLILLFQGFVEAAVSSLWTLAYRSWIGGPELVEKTPEMV